MLCNWITIFLGLIVCVLLFFIVRKELRKIRENMEISDLTLNRIVQKMSAIPDIKNVIDKLTFNPGEKSYTINKEEIYICLKDENGEYYDENMLMYVTLHEMAHVLCDEIGHTPKFREIFDDLLRKASDIGIYDNTKPPIPDYCMYPDKRN
jgi:beta-lactamase regulating signal transducer with metallopeptidase domain